jgi:FMN-dependent NADH-azoreductase
MLGHEELMMTNTKVNRILRIDSSASYSDSVTRRLGDEVIRRIKQEHPGAELIERNLSNGIQFLNEKWVHASLTNPVERNQEQQEVLADSDQLVKELNSADTIVITAPVYNFSVPATLKAWIDMICRASLTFSYTEKGPQGLLKDRPVYLVMASGGVPFGSPVDFASGYMRHLLGFIGLRDVRAVYAEATNSNASASEAVALDMLAQWLPLESAAVA